MASKNLLVISNDFPNADNKYVREIFVKEQVMFLKEHFDNIYVVSPVAHGMELLRKTRHENYTFDNVHVYFPKYMNCPLFFKYGRDFWIYFEEKAVKKLIEDENLQFDLIHAHFTWRAGAVAVKLKEMYKVPVVITEHTSRTFNNAVKRKEPQFIRPWNLCDAIIRVRKGDISLFKSVGVPLDKVYYIPNGYSPKSFPDLDQQSCRKKLGLPLDKKIILNVGSLYGEVKGHKYLIEAMNEIIMQRKDVICFIVGGGKLEKKLKKQISSSGLEDYVKLTGSRPYTEIPLWMSACDVFVLPSLHESFGIVQIEAMSCGKPVVATYNGGSEEVLISESYGYLVEPTKSKELAEKVLVALDKEWNNEQIKKYAMNFKWDTIAEEILRIYKKVGV
ncbi:MULTISPECIES: glycosyltransferase family 4 protein [unclassified Methanosarcina]|uniref:glycosyltransferase family 4 protein n=1 Tax=unclassified Methanosarcina TaxID=2644672 RepID=UPI0006160A28|nr:MULTISPECIES: glycosyltransferase family 4 protein [unclassified Methanosarcina]AKB17642.1 Glycosyltransferase [Methanosarcina sp. WWM596]AKB21013.1 Glycosyltransferase [Methanosarcina sp. WH1]